MFHLIETAKTYLFLGKSEVYDYTILIWIHEDGLSISAAKLISVTITLFYLAAHRALADVEAMKDVLFCTELKHLQDQHEQWLRSPLQQKTKFKTQVLIRERTKTLLLKFGNLISANMAKKIAGEGLDFAQLKDLRAKFNEKAKFVQCLRAKGLSPMCSQKLSTYFFGS